jgi:hypothetical protein
MSANCSGLSKYIQPRSPELTTRRQEERFDLRIQQYSQQHAEPKVIVDNSQVNVIATFVIIPVVVGSFRIGDRQVSDSNSIVQYRQNG